MASKFNDEGVNSLFVMLLTALRNKANVDWLAGDFGKTAEVSQAVIPPARIRYLSEISDVVRNYNNWAKEQSDLASDLYKLDGVIKMGYL